MASHVVHPRRDEGGPEEGRVDRERNESSVGRIDVLLKTHVPLFISPGLPTDKGDFRTPGQRFQSVSPRRGLRRRPDVPGCPERTRVRYTRGGTGEWVDGFFR